MQKAPAKLQSMFISLLKQDFVRFCVVGCFGFLMNLGLLTLLYKMIGLPIFIAQLISAEISMLASFSFHNVWTYRGRSDKTISQLLVQFHLSSWTGMLLNTTVVYIIVTWIHKDYVIALVIASLIVLFWNYFWTKFYIWRNLQHQDTMNDPSTTDQ